MRSVQIGVVALMTAAVLLGIVRSPHAKQVNGMALLKSATSKSHGKSWRGGNERRVTAITLHSNSAPAVHRNSATHNGGRLSPAMRISRKETPQTAESRSSCSK